MRSRPFFLLPRIKTRSLQFVKTKFYKTCLIAFATVALNKRIDFIKESSNFGTSSAPKSPTDITGTNTTTSPTHLLNTVPASTRTAKLGFYISRPFLDTSKERVENVVKHLLGTDDVKAICLLRKDADMSSVTFISYKVINSDTWPAGLPVREFDERKKLCTSIKFSPNITYKQHNINIHCTYNNTHWAVCTQSHDCSPAHLNEPMISIHTPPQQYQQIKTNAPSQFIIKMFAA